MTARSEASSLWDVFDLTNDGVVDEGDPNANLAAPDGNPLHLAPSRAYDRPD